MRPGRPVRLRAIAILFIASFAIAANLAPTPASQTSARADADFLVKAYDTYRAMAQSSPHAAIPWQYLGPTNVSGRATDVEVADRPGARRIYVAYATSGVWKTDDNGTTWQPIFEDAASTSIGDIAVSPSNPDIVWVGTGEANLFRASMPGVGLYKSIDAGRTFTHVGLADTHTIARIRIHPTDPDIVFVAASGHGWTDNEMRGVFKTTDGGKTWRKTLYVSSRTGAIDLVTDPQDANTVYAATWQRIRRKWSDPRVEPGYDESGVWKSTDAGQTWSQINVGLPAGQYRGRIGLDVARSRPSVLYAFVDNYAEGTPPKPGDRDAYGRPIVEGRIKSAEIYRSDDKGATWSRVSQSNDYMLRHSGTYGWVFGQMRVDPTDENTIYTLGIDLNVSRDGGKTFSRLTGMHVDHHGLWIDPKNPSVLYNANDGGFYQSENAGKTWRFAARAGGAQFYNVVLDSTMPPWAYGSVQDHGSRRGRVDVMAGRDRVPALEWTSAPGGEGSNHAIDPGNPSLVYSHGFYGNFTREDLEMSQRGRTGDERGRGRGRDRPGVTNIRPRTSESEPELRAQWMAPLIVSEHDRNVIYAGYQFVFRSSNRGDAWERMSADLTSNDAAQRLLKSSSAIPYQTIVALAESPRIKGVLYAGTDDGRLHVTMDDGRTWQDRTAALSVRKWISRVVASRHADGTVYVTARGREDDEFGVYIYKSTDYGRTFTTLAANLPAGSVNVIREDPENASVLYAGTDFGAFISLNGGEHWDVLGSGLPSVQVSDLQFHPRDRVIVISTYGRGMYALDALRITGRRP